MATFEELAASRREWIDIVLRPWCAQAAWKDLKKAEDEWPDVAGRADPEATLWTWAWGRFPDLVHEGLTGVDESCEVRVTLRNGTTASGFPDGRKSREGRLVLLRAAPPPASFEEDGPFLIDEIASVSRVEGQPGPAAQGDSGGEAPGE